MPSGAQSVQRLSACSITPAQRCVYETAAPRTTLPVSDPCSLPCAFRAERQLCRAVGSFLGAKARNDGQLRVLKGGVMGALRLAQVGAWRGWCRGWTGRLVAHMCRATLQRGDVVGVRILEQAALGGCHAAVAQAVGYGAIQVLGSLLRSCTEDTLRCNDATAVAVVRCLDALLRMPLRCAEAVADFKCVLQPLRALATSSLMLEDVRRTAVSVRSRWTCFAGIEPCVTLWCVSGHIPGHSRQAAWMRWQSRS